jgi:aminomethyltransferase
VLTHAGLFDTSHMAVVDIEGPDARGLLQLCFTKDLDACIGRSLRPIDTGRCVYGAFLDPEGGVIDDSIVYKRAGGRYMAVVNTGMGAGIAAHLKRQSGGRDVRVTDRTDRLGKIDIQGPLAAVILSGIIADAGAVFDSMPYFSFKGGTGDRLPASTAVRLKSGIPILLSRTGYTGEFGFELFMDVEKTAAVWDALMAAGGDRGLTACGLAARDSLRAGAVLPLAHQDIGPWPFINHPWPFALPFDARGEGFTKPFIGGAALLEAKSAGFTLPFAGYDLRKVATGDPAVVLDDNGTTIGRVLTCASDMGIDRLDGRIVSIASPDLPRDFKPRGLCCGFVKVDRNLPPGRAVRLKDNRRTITVAITDDVRPHRTARRKLADMLPQAD